MAGQCDPSKLHYLGQQKQHVHQILLQVRQEDRLVLMAEGGISLAVAARVQAAPLHTQGTFWTWRGRLISSILII